MTLIDRKDYDKWKRNVRFDLALAETTKIFIRAEDINTVNKRYRQHLDSCTCAADVFKLEGRLFNYA